MRKPLASALTDSIRRIKLSKFRVFQYSTGAELSKRNLKAEQMLHRTKLLSLSVLLCVSWSPASPNSGVRDSQKTFVLIHGSWHSAWNWYKVTPILEKRGHRVLAPDLPAMGRDKTPVQEVEFDKTVDQLCQMIDAVEGQVVLVGHSKNGVLISQVAEKRPHKVEKLVYLAAVLAKNGKSAVDYFRLDEGEVLGPHITYDSATNSSRLLPAIYREGLYHDCEEEITDMANIILSDEPRQTATHPIAITEKNWGSVPRYYIECTEDRAITPPLQQRMYREIPCEKVYKLNSSHSPFFSMPEALVDILIDIAKK